LSDKAETLQFRRRFRFIFIFRIVPGFFVGIIPGGRMRFDLEYGSNYDDEMTIMRISEQEYMFLRRIGVPECRVMSQQAYEGFEGF
jgi:hypothetical protein